ncbi:hypothetical protein AUJ14_04335 [Candidatus Micrarchaeota archaeon CG1_02_55_22]|nr:MAG: hypothetical protein AUJ14_04335 [Candidatus Micrarchaeota archaeon CG1_02_55_22]
MKSRNSRKKNSSGLVSLAIAIVVALASVGLLYTVAGIVTSGEPIGRMGFMRTQSFLNESIIIASFTMLLLIALLTQYIQTYIELRSEFTLGLIILVVALFLNAASANPLLFTRLGYGPMTGPFSFIPGLFSLAAAIVLLYLNNK